MARDEFSIIEHYFSAIGESAGDMVLGIGDDAAVVSLAAERQLVVAMDTLISGVHFPEDTDPGDIAWKALAVNLSDLAAMAAEPAWFQLSLTLPQVDETWLRHFAQALGQAAVEYRLVLIGGDTCRGNLSITIQIAGTVPQNEFVTRAGASPGDRIVVSGELGNAALGLAHLRGDIKLPAALRQKCAQALARPHPRLELTPFLRQSATAAIDISDGLQGDLGHILKASACGAVIERDKIPVDAWIRQQQAYHYALAAGDDYEICCCVGSRHLADIETWNREHPDCRLSIIGEITRDGYVMQQGEDRVDLRSQSGFRHFV